MQRRMQLAARAVIVATIVRSLMFTGTAAAQERPVAWSGGASKTTAPGGVVTIHLKARIDDGWHLYSITQGAGGPSRTKIGVAADQPFTLADSVTGPKPVKRFDPNFGIDVEMYDHEATFVVPVRAAGTTSPGKYSVVVTARYQTCGATVCLPPHTQRIPVAVTVASATPRG